MKASMGTNSAHTRHQAIDATDFDATAHPTKPHVNGARDRQGVWADAWVLPKQWVAGSNPVSRSKPSCLAYWREAVSVIAYARIGGDDLLARAYCVVWSIALGVSPWGYRPGHVTAVAIPWRQRR